MPKTKISEFDVDPANNTDINSINIAEGCAPSGINNAIRQLMSDLKEFQTGAGGDPVTVGGAFAANGGATLGDASGDALTINSSAVSIPNGLNFDSNTFVIDATNNNVGIGVASPTARLDVTGSSFATANVNFARRTDDTTVSTAVTWSSSDGNYMIRNSGGALTFNSGNTIGSSVGTERMRIDSSGNVGIGTSSPSNKLSVNSGSSTTVAGFTSTGSSAYVGLTNSGASAFLGSDSSGNFIVQTPGSAYSTKLLVDSSGNVGIGTSSPNFNASTGTVCHINSASSIGWAVNHYTTLATGSAAGDGMIVGMIGSDAYVFNYESSPLIFGAGGSERMRIGSNGDVLIGKGASDVTFAGCYFENNSIGYGRLNIIKAVGGSTPAVAFYYSGTQIGTISNSTTATSYNTSSDYRLKDITGDLTGYKERIMALQPKQGSWKVDGSVFKGFIAHEFAEQYPNAVSGEKDAVDAEGKPMYQGMQAGGAETIADLVALAKEQQAIITDLKARIETLESK